MSQWLKPRRNPATLPAVVGAIHEITVLSDGTNAMPMDKLLTRTDPNTICQLLAEKSLPTQLEFPSMRF
ncbi:MAG: hypothetical protein ACR5LD_02775 [Symbiopectobacterium sp.]